MKLSYQLLMKSVIQVVRNQQEGSKFLTVGEMYFNLPQLQTRLEQIGRVTKDGEKKLQERQDIMLKKP